MHFREVRALFSVQRIDKIHPYIILRLTVLSTIQMIDPSNKKKDGSHSPNRNEIKKK